MILNKKFIIILLEGLSTVIVSPKEMKGSVFPTLHARRRQAFSVYDIQAQ